MQTKGSLTGCLLLLHRFTGGVGNTLFPGSILPIGEGDNQPNDQVGEGHWFRPDGTAGRVSMKRIPMRDAGTARRLKRVSFFKTTYISVNSLL